PEYPRRDARSRRVGCNLACRGRGRVSEWKAFAKLTLSLRVLGSRADGYHDLDALTVSVSEPHDEVTVELRGDDVVIELSGPAVDGVTDGPDNLAARAARALLEQSSRQTRAVGVRIGVR